MSERIKCQLQTEKLVPSLLYTCNTSTSPYLTVWPQVSGTLWFARRCLVGCKHSIQQQWIMQWENYFCSGSLSILLIISRRKNEYGASRSLTLAEQLLIFLCNQEQIKSLRKRQCNAIEMKFINLLYCIYLHSYFLLIGFQFLLKVAI